MTFLPIVDRELRVAARRPMTFWLRIIAALTAVVIASGLLALFMNVPRGFGSQPGGPLFAVLTWMSLAVSLTAGLFFTSDALSEEKREGTLGFLFLTDLRGYDVVLGKLLATSCRCVFALLAIFPVLACTLLLGGVAAGDFWRTILALLHTLFFSLTAGILISSISRHPQKALVGTLALLFIVVAGGPAMDSMFAFASGNSFRPGLSLASPVTVFINAGGGGYAAFWRAFLVSEGVAWMLLAAACVLIPRTWQVQATRVAVKRSEWRDWLRFGSEQGRSRLRFVMLEKNPVTWLVCRERWQALFSWALAALVLVWFMVASLFENSLLNWAGWQALISLSLLFLYLWTASHASQFFAEARRGGLLELLLSTPLDFASVAPGAWLGLVRLFGIPVGIILVIQFLAPVTGGKGAGGIFYPGGDGPLPEWVMVWGVAGCSLAMTVANLVALAWFGLWMGLISRNGLMATMKTIVFVQIIPWMVIAFISALAIPMLAMVVSTASSTGKTPVWLQLYPIVSAGIMTVLTLLKDYIFWRVARRKLVENFRDTATRAIVPVVWTKGRVQVVPPPSGVPPILPPLPKA